MDTCFLNYQSLDVAPMCYTVNGMSGLCSLRFFIVLYKSFKSPLVCSVLYAYNGHVF